MKKTILLAVAVTGVFVTSNAFAGAALLSPRAQEQADSLIKVPRTMPDMVMVNHAIQSGSPRSMEFAASLRKVPSMGNNVDVVHAPRPTLAPRDVRYETAWRENALNQQIQVAPLK